jgi:hypothetical protein
VGVASPVATVVDVPAASDQSTSPPFATKASCVPLGENVAGPASFVTRCGVLPLTMFSLYSANRGQGPSPHSLSPGSALRAPTNVIIVRLGESATEFMPHTASICAP